MDKPISEFEQVVQLATTDVLPIVNLGTTRKVSIEQLLDLLPQAPTKTSDLVNDGENGIEPFITLAEIPTVTGFVPYIGAVSDVNLGEFGLQTGNIEFDLTPTNVPTTVGSLVWNDTAGTLDLKLKGGNTTLQIGQETVARVVNRTSTNISLLEANYQAVRVTGAQGQRPKVDLAQANNDLNSTTTLGLVTETILNNQEGFITTSGQVQQVNTTGSLQGETWLDGDVLYLSGTVAGRITNIKPIAPIHTVIIGFVEYAHINQGKIFVKVDNGYELDELHNVSAIAPNNNEVLTYDTATLLWKPKTLSSILPAITITDTFVVASQVAMLAIIGETGDVAIRTDLSKTFILKGTNPTILANWQEILTPTGGAVASVFNRTGNVVAVSGDYTADQITETATRKFQTANQNIFNDATSSIQTQLNGKALTSDIAIKAIDEGNGIGYVIANRNPLNYGNIGLNSVDLSYSNSPNSTYGATGVGSFVGGNNSTASGYYSTAFGANSIASGDVSVAMGLSTKASANGSTATGNNTTASGTYSTASGLSSTASGEAATASGSYNIASGDNSTASGSESIASGDNSTAIGKLLNAKSYAESVFGAYNTNYTPISSVNSQPLDRVFGVGNGTSELLRSDALIILKNGLTTLPSVTNALIAAEPTGKAVVTKEYLSANYTLAGSSTTVSSSTYFQNITLVPTIIDGMSMAPTTAGTYKVDFNTQFNTALANITEQSVVDLNNLYLNLNSQAVTNTTFPPMTAGTTIFAGVYETAGAVGPIGSITLDGQGNQNSIFIFRTIAAFSTGAGNVFNLINGAKASNVFVVASGAITLGAGSNFSGTLLSPLAAIGVGAGAFLNGRVFSMAAAISTLGNITTPTDAGQFPMGILPNFAMFTSIGAVTNVGSNIIIGDIGTNNGTVTGFQFATLSGYIYLPAQGASNCQFSIYVNGTIVPTSTRERTNSISKDDVILSDKVTITAGQTISIKNTNSIGISRFYNRSLTITKV